MVHTLLSWRSTPGHGLAMQPQFHCLFPTGQGLQTCHFLVAMRVQAPTMWSQEPTARISRMDTPRPRHPLGIHRVPGTVSLLGVEHPTRQTESCLPGVLGPKGKMDNQTNNGHTVWGDGSGEEEVCLSTQESITHSILQAQGKFLRGSRRLAGV